MERQSDNTPWALKLKEVTLPDAGESWETMATILDREMPAERKRRRRWLLLLLLLPLAAISGYLVWRAQRGTSTASPLRAGNLPEGKRGDAPENARGVSSGTVRKDSFGTVRGVSPARSPVPTIGTSSVRTSETLPAPTFETSSVPTSVTPVYSGSTTTGRVAPGHLAPLGIAGPNLRVTNIAHSGDPLKCPPVEKPKASGWVVGVGLNQSIPVDGQQVWTNPSGGLNTWWKDYIPVPFVRYYFQPKVFLQAEVRFHSPQYTPKTLWFYYRYNDSLTTWPLSIKKFFYFQLPLTIHYAPTPEWSFGFGVQYSRYGSGIVAATDSGVYNNFYHSIGPLSDYPMVFVQRNEFRGLISVDYNYRHWIIGMSYDQAFTSVLAVRVPDPGANPQAAVEYAPPAIRNSSLQLFVRYILWDGRKSPSK